ncbi:MAG: endonuclease domain-containing protein [Sphingomonas sp.]|nr:endonuclease domain-containing protein [Sphingomonas sp.]
MRAFAKELRHNPTPMEERLWQRLRASQLEGLKFRFQHTIEPCIVDFCCARIGLVVEVDGDTHNADKDRDRDIGLGQLGYTVVRFTNHEVVTNIDGVLETIVARARDPGVRQWNRGVTHPPTPSLGREGE